MHQAIARLQYDRLVQVIPRKGIVVRPVSIDEYLDLTDVRLVNDVEAARLAALHRTPEDLEQMERLIDEMESAYASDDLRTVILADRELHVFIARCSGNAVLEEVVRSIFDRTLRSGLCCTGRPAAASDRCRASIVNSSSPFASATLTGQPRSCTSTS